MRETRKDYEIVFEQQKKFLLKSCVDFDKGDECEAIRIAGHLRTILHDSFQVKNFDTKLTTLLSDAHKLIESDNFTNKKKVLNKINGIRQKIEQQQKKQIVSKSLLTQLKIKEKLHFLDTSLSKGSFSFYNMSNLRNTTIISKSYYGLLAKEVNVEDGKEILKYLPLCLHENSKNYFESCPNLKFDDWWHKNIYDDGKGIMFSRKELVTYVANHDGYAHVEENIDNKYQSFKDANILENFINSNKKTKVNLATLNSIRQIAYEVLTTMNEIT